MEPIGGVDCREDAFEKDSNLIFSDIKIDKTEIPSYTVDYYNLLSSDQFFKLSNI